VDKSKKRLQLTIFDDGAVLITSGEPVDKPRSLVDNIDFQAEVKQRKREQQRAYRARKKAERAH
jgi:hypothetical protein